MSNNRSEIECQAADKTKCRFHGDHSKILLQEAIKNQDYAAFEQSKAIEAERASKVATPKEEAGFVHDGKYRNVKKMPALFVIDREAHLATTELNEKATWIFDEPSRATLKKDGTSVTVTEDGKIYARRSVKKGKKAPPGFILAEVDPYTGHSFGLEPVEQSGFAKMFTEAADGQKLEPGTYELCGPKINGNPESLTAPRLMSHGSEEATEIPDMRTMPKEQAFETLKGIFADYKSRGIEGVVWWGENGKRTKLRVYDFFGDPHRQ